MTVSQNGAQHGGVDDNIARRAGEQAHAAPAVQRLEQILRQAETTLREETRLLRAGDSVELAALTERKGRILMELSRTANAAAPVEAGDGVQRAIADFRQALEENAAVLKAHLGAVSEIVQLLAENVRAAASDGTYGRSIATRPPK